MSISYSFGIEDNNIDIDSFEELIKQDNYNNIYVAGIIN